MKLILSFALIFSAFSCSNRNDDSTSGIETTTTGLATTLKNTRGNTIYV